MPATVTGIRSSHADGVRADVVSAVAAIGELIVAAAAGAACL
jgi:hypothetical protein